MKNADSGVYALAHSMSVLFSAFSNLFRVFDIVFLYV